MRTSTARSALLLVLAAGLTLAWSPPPASARSAPPALPQEATRAAGGGQEGGGVPATPDSVVVPDSAVVTGARLDELTAQVASQLRCPVCRNQSVLESSSTLAREMQAEIKRRLARGDTPPEVRAYFVSRYGEWVLLKPKAEGINLVVYLFPALAVLGGGLIVWRLLGHWIGDEEEPAEGVADAAGEDDGPVGEEDLSEREQERLASALEEQAGPGA